MHISIQTPQGTLYDGEVEKIQVPGSLGPMEILRNHAPILTSLQKGSLTFQARGGESKSYQVTGGFLEFSNNQGTVLVDGVDSQSQ